MKSFDFDTQPHDPSAWHPTTPRLNSTHDSHSRCAASRPGQIHQTTHRHTHITERILIKHANRPHRQRVRCGVMSSHFILQAQTIIIKRTRVCAYNMCVYVHARTHTHTMTCKHSRVCMLHYMLYTTLLTRAYIRNAHAHAQLFLSLCGVRGAAHACVIHIKRCGNREPVRCGLFPSSGVCGGAGWWCGVSALCCLHTKTMCERAECVRRCVDHRVQAGRTCAKRVWCLVFFLLCTLHTYGMYMMCVVWCILYEICSL